MVQHAIKADGGIQRQRLGAAMAVGRRRDAAGGSGHYRVGTGEIGAFTRRIQRAYDDAIRAADSRWRHWLTPFRLPSLARS